MNVALIGASGNVGSRIENELVRRGHTVTAIARNPEKVKAQSGVIPQRGDARNPGELAELLRNHDVVVSAVRFVDSDPKDLIEAVRLSGVRRYLVVGGAGSLEIAPGKMLLDSPEFPAAYLPEAKKGMEFLQTLRQTNDLDWTFISPSAEFGPGERTGTFRLGGDQLLSNTAGSKISYEDFAIALVDEMEKPAHIRERFTVGY